MVLDLLITEEQHDIISYFDSYCDCDGYTVGVMEDEDGMYIQVDIGEESIIVEKGVWYFA